MFEKLNVVKGGKFDEKIFNFLETSAIMRLRECEKRMFGFESRYGMDFESFSKAWKKGSITDKHSHAVERDYMEWEGFEAERKKWLKTLRTSRIRA